MESYKLEIKLESNTLIGSGEGFGSIIDTDIVFDDLGIPYIPAKRIKGCIRDSAEQIKEMFKLSQITDMTLSIDSIFSKIHFSNLYIKDYTDTKQWIKYLFSEYGNIFSKDAVIDSLTNVRHQTTINDNGVAKDHSLRTVRVAKKGLVFEGDIQIEDKDAIKMLTLACMNFHYMGTKRNRGFGKIKCEITGNNKETILKELEEKCKV